MIYISGKITGDCNYKDKFKKAKENLIKEGYKEDEIISPTEIILPYDATYNDAMRACIKHLNDCSCIYMLKDWRESHGASIEFGFALAQEKEIKYEGAKI